MKVIGTGLSGLVGSRIVELLSADWEFEDLSLSTGIDITDTATVVSRISASDAPWVLHLAAATDVDGVESERTLGEKSKSWNVNVMATASIVRACQASGKRLLYISTDYVFDGTKDVYAESDAPNPTGWYGITKWEGEKRVVALGPAGVIVRIANPYKRRDSIKGDFVHKIVDLLVQSETVSAPSDQLFVPTFVDDIASALGRIMQQGGTGIYHVVGADALSPYDAARSIARIWGYDEKLVHATTFSHYFAWRAPRPFHAHLVSDRISKLGITMSSFASGLEQVKRQDDSASKSFPSKPG